MFWSSWEDEIMEWPNNRRDWTLELSVNPNPPLLGRETLPYLFSRSRYFYIFEDLILLLKLIRTCTVLFVPCCDATLFPATADVHFVFLSLSRSRVCYLWGIARPCITSHPSCLFYCIFVVPLCVCVFVHLCVCFLIWVLR